jgi:phage shock protein PspC (stress-responsive transcriptional regulator)
MACLLGFAQGTVAQQQDEQQPEMGELIDSTQTDGVEAFSDTTAVDTGTVEVVTPQAPMDDEDFVKIENLFNSSGGIFMIFSMILTLMFTIFIFSLPLLIVIVLILLVVMLFRRRPKQTELNNALNNNMDMEQGKKLRRSQDRVIGGVCGGLAEYFGFDPTVVRVAFALLTFFTAFSGIPVYLILWLVMPSR